MRMGMRRRKGESLLTPVLLSFSSPLIYLPSISNHLLSRVKITNVYVFMIRYASTVTGGTGTSALAKGDQEPSTSGGPHLFQTSDRMDPAVTETGDTVRGG